MLPKRQFMSFSEVKRLVMSMQIGDECQGCHQKFETLEQMQDTVWWPWEGGHIGHKKCYQEAKHVP